MTVIARAAATTGTTTPDLGYSTASPSLGESGEAAKNKYIPELYAKKVL